MKNLFSFLKALANIGVAIYLIVLFVFLPMQNITISIFIAALLVANILVAIKANKILDNIEEKQGAKMAIFYLFVGLLLFAFLNFGLCLFSVSI